MKLLPRVCILTAGKGNRLGRSAETLNKALHPVNSKAAISWIIDKFPNNTEFVIGLGYLGDQVKNYLLLTHSETKFHFVRIKNYNGPGSGPGHSLNCCKSFLENPFFFVSCE